MLRSVFDRSPGQANLIEGQTEGHTDDTGCSSEQVLSVHLLSLTQDDGRGSEHGAAQRVHQPEGGAAEQRRVKGQEDEATPHKEGEEHCRGQQGHTMLQNIPAKATATT